MAISQSITATSRSWGAASTGSGESVFVIERSARPPTDVSKVSDSSPGLASFDEVTVAVLLTVVGASARNVRANCAVWPAGKVAAVQVTVPASVTVPAGQTTAAFTIATSSVTATTVVRISASYNGATLNADTIPRLRCRIVAGAANNQLAAATAQMSLRSNAASATCLATLIPPIRPASI